MAAPARPKPGSPQKRETLHRQVRGMYDPHFTILLDAAVRKASSFIPQETSAQDFRPFFTAPCGVHTPRRRAG